MNAALVVLPTTDYVGRSFLTEFIKMDGQRNNGGNYENDRFDRWNELGKYRYILSGDQ